MFSDLVDLRKKMPDTANTEALYKGEVDILDLSVREAMEISDFFDFPLPFFVCICHSEHPTNDIAVLEDRLTRGIEQWGETEFFNRCVRERTLEVYWILRFYRGSYYYLDRIDRFCDENGYDYVKHYDKIRSSDRTQVLGEYP